MSETRTTTDLDAIGWTLILPRMDFCSVYDFYRLFLFSPLDPGTTVVTRWKIGSDFGIEEQYPLWFVEITSRVTIINSKHNDRGFLGINYVRVQGWLRYFGGRVDLKHFEGEPYLLILYL